MEHAPLTRKSATYYALAEILSWLRSTAALVYPRDAMMPGTNAVADHDGAVDLPICHDPIEGFMIQSVYARETTISEKLSSDEETLFVGV